MSKKLNIAVIFGGRSGEHEVSLVSAESVMKHLDQEKYNVIPVGITKDGAWIAGKNSLKLLKNNEIPKALKTILTPDATNKALMPIDQGGLASKIDVVFPVLHGTYGEDGAIQGLLELANIPYVGCGILSSAVGMDKLAQKIMCSAEKILVPDWLWLSRKEWHWFKQSKSVFKKWLTEVEKRLNYPMFVKPANSGSSVGISKAHNRQELIKAINLAARYDRRIIIEKGIEKAMEVEVSVLGNDKPEVSLPGQILPSNEFYDYDAKYVAGKSKTIIPAPLPDEVTRKVQEIAMEVFKLLDCAGMARADFLLAKNGRHWQIYFSELNTIPGFTSISMYPKLWQASGVPYKKLLDILIRLALERHHEKSVLSTTYRTSGWYK
ncbi:D-alanine--D-alanine ligase A [Candidatus Kuenenbacteria bacterium CG22_combo_CG10-13_8_21_14_all_39_9]|uniref:D-alanine--D-alanine ligase n=1 Tax=Candidatus Kuenenbacteria bacterium CG22_combo_CG10-13_8_21_14_all_39_9 TaxID=1974621 RepID=A0A2H0D045_9BACT|nr:MAG: D-alanine--D-alanine ligase A [Candidatus Kuenenbacteria bacterium CG22_combo_CG10-13_8_21_14_all_39_9]